MPTYITTAAIPPLRTVWSDAHGVWELELGFELLDGRPECVRLVIEPAHGVATRAITTKTIRGLRLNELVNNWLHTQQSIADAHLESLTDAAEKATVDESALAVLIETATQDAQALGRAHKRSGAPQQHFADHYREVAQVYSEAIRQREPPAKAVRARWHYSSATASRHISKARSLGFLPPTRPGVATAAALSP